MTILQETGMRIEDVKSLADRVYDNDNIGASIASGTFHTDGMIVVPCSMKTVAGIAQGYSDNLLLRACDVMIKEQRKLILVTRESCRPDGSGIRPETGITATRKKKGDSAECRPDGTTTLQMETGIT